MPNLTGFGDHYARHVVAAHDVSRDYLALFYVSSRKLSAHQIFDRSIRCRTIVTYLGVCALENSREIMCNCHGGW